MLSNLSTVVVLSVLGPERPRDLSQSYDIVTFGVLRVTVTAPVVLPTFLSNQRRSPESYPCFPPFEKQPGSTCSLLLSL